MPHVSLPALRSSSVRSSSAARKASRHGPRELFVSGAFAAIGALAYTDTVAFGVLATALMFLALVDLSIAVDDTPPIRELAGLVAILQLVFMPWLLYAFFNYHARYYMHVDPSEYFTFAIPSTCLYVLGMRARLPFGRDVPVMHSGDASRFTLGMVFVVGGLVAGVLSRFGPDSLAFLFYLLSNFRYIGAIYVYASGNRLRWIVICFVVLSLLSTSAKFGMFHELFLWASLGGSYWFISRRRSIKTKLGVLVAIVLLVSVVQGMKSEYRERLASNPKTSFVDSVADYIRSRDLFSNNWGHNMVVRLAQGWIVSAAMEHVPARVPYARGETIQNAALAALVPRFILPQKAKASSRANVNRFTNLRLGENTAMGLSPLGEGYVNFGIYGGMLTMLCYGVLINVVFRTLSQWSISDDYFCYCMPLVFLQVIKIETEFLTVFNHLSKSLVLVCLVCYAARMLGLMSKPLGSRPDRRLGR